ncbi:MAG: transglycosylase domain-containing protein [Patescibacteria group bacterium]|jgi:1A family penicillin-binding protein
MSAKKTWEKRQKQKNVKKQKKQSRTKSYSFSIEKSWLKHLGKTRYTLALGFVVLLLLVFSVASYLFIFKDLPSPTNLTKNDFPVSTEIYDREGRLLYEIYAEQNRKPIKLKNIPRHVKEATIAIEDKDFYKHGGFAITGITRALYKNIFKGEFQGGSTITQQLVKTALLTPERTIRRKVRELLLSSVIEILYSKDEILEMYLNHIPYGGTAYGIEQAAHLYFGKSAKDLSLAESALLAGLPQAPSRYSPFGSNPELAKQRQEQVLQRMVEDGYITPEEKEQAYNTKLTYAKQHIDIKAPHFVLYVKDLLVEKYGQKKVEQGGLRVTTTLDLPFQEYAQASVAAEIATLERYNVTNGATLVTKPSTGEILAMVGSRGYFDEAIDGKVNLTTSLRQPGSSIKPLNYALGIFKGYPASTMFLDIPTCFTAPGQPSAYCPKNYDGRFHGPQQMRYALANSYNIPAVKMLALNTVEDFIATASAMGISTWHNPKNYGLSLTLGGGEVKMVDMAVAFGTLANSGIRIDLNPILKVETYKGEILEEYNHEKNPPTGKRILPPEVTFIISDILADNRARIPAFGAYSKLVIPDKTVSVKTGTTDDLRDNWTVGYTPEFLAAVWVGNNDNSKMNGYVVSGVTGAAPIWNSVMSYVLDGREDVIPPKPENVIGTSVCAYQQTNPENPQTCEGRFEYFIKGTETNQLHGYIAKKNTWIDKETGRPPLPGKVDNLELQERLMASDAFTADYCVDCSHEGEPPTTINLNQFYSKLEAKNNP